MTDDDLPKGVFRRGNRLWLTFKDATGVWRNVTSGVNVGQSDLAVEMLKRILDGVRQATGTPDLVMVAPTVRVYADAWIPKRREADLDWKNDRSRLNHHVLPVIGDMKIADVRARHLVELVHGWRFKTKLAQRTVYNVYSVCSAMFRDAQLAGVIEQSPCILTDAQLGPLTDKDPEWRDGAVFTRDEAETLISDERIPFDRRMVYAFGLLAGMRPGEAAALRWSHYDPTVRPLGKLRIARAYNSRKNSVKSTKTDAVRVVPVHPTLAAMLAEWKLGGWAAMMGRSPEPGDLIVPLPPAAADARRSREGDAYRSIDYSGKRWRDDDMKMLQAEGWRYREPYATKSTFITIVIEDGANRDVIRDRVTHAKARRDAFDGYDRGPHWLETCREVAKLRLVRRTQVIALAMVAGSPRAPTADLELKTPDPLTESVTGPEDTEIKNKVSGGGGSRRHEIEHTATAGIKDQREVSPRVLSSNGADCSNAVRASLQLVAARDPVDEAIAAVERALVADPRRTRLALLRLLTDLEEKQD